MKIDRNKLQEYVERGLIRETKHPEYNLFLYKYTEKCAFENKWDDFTKMCRGLVLDEDGNIVINSMPKFFNYEQHVFYQMSDLPYTVYPKLDGSLIQVAWYNPISEELPTELIVTSSGSFSSWHSNRAEELLSTPIQNQDKFDFDKTYIFELIGPENQIVVKYPEEKLVLLVVRETKTGIELPLELFADKFEIAKPLWYKQEITINELADEIRSETYNNEEGFILKFSNGERIKFKYHEYIRLHKMMTGVSEKWIWEALKEGSGLTLDNVPDELYDWVNEKRMGLEQKFAEIKEEAASQFIEVYLNLCGLSFAPRKFSKKEFAETITNPKSPYYKNKHLLFAMYDEKPCDDIIWKMIEPGGETRKFAKTKDLCGASGVVYLDEISGLNHKEF